MKRFMQTTAFIFTVLIQIQLWAQPVNTPDVMVSTEVDIDQYNPSVFVNPWNPDEVINSSQRYNHTYLGGVLMWSLEPTDFYHSENAGASWSMGTNLLERLSMDAYPAVQINHDGRYYVNYCDINLGVYLAWSDDMGTSWQEKRLKAKPDQALQYVSTNNFWIDNSERSMYKGNVYASWRFIAYESSDYCIELTRQEYGSDEWSNPTNICSYESGDETFEEWPVVKTGPNGEVYACWMNHDDGPGTGETSIGFNSSYDGGKTFGINTNLVSDIKGLTGYQNLVDLDLISAPDMAVDVSGGPNDGKAYIVWANVGVPGINAGQDVDIYMISSDAYGVNWSDPVRVNQDPVGLSKEHFMPAITCDPETGTVTVIYYDNRNLGSNMLEVWGSISYDGGNSFTDFQISDVAMNRTNLISVSDNTRLSYKIGVSSANGKVVPVWADFREQFCRTVTSPFMEKPVAKPNNLVAQIIDWDNGTALLNWDMESPAGLEHYNIYRDNEIIATTSETEFEETLTEYGKYTYRVTAQFPTMESAPETDFVDWGIAEFSSNRDDFDVKLEPGTSTTYVLILENEGTLPVDYCYTIEHNPEAGTLKDNDFDEFGYHWIDSDNPGGPGFDYIDISETGIEITGITNDNYVGPFSVGFSFPFYENYYNEFYISSNGLITFDGSFSNPTNSPIPIPDGNNNFIAWCWDDLQKKTGGQVFYQHFEDYTVIQFKDYAQNGLFSARYVINAEVILYKNGDVTIQYLDYTSGLFQTNSCSIGIENANGSDGLQVAYDEMYIHDELAVRFFNPGVKWIYSDLPYGTIDAQSESLVYLQFKSLDLPLGEYFANINFITNATQTQEYVITAKLEIVNSVLGKPTSLDYTLTGNDVELVWEAPQGKDLLGYNIYESGEIVNAQLITQTNYFMESLSAGGYLFQVTAIYDEGESNPEGNPLFVFVTDVAQQSVLISNGWSGVSTYVEPLDPDIESVFSAIVDDVVIVVGEEGLYWPAQNINTIGNWDNDAGYKIKLLQEQSLTFSGNEMSMPAVYCNEGWNLIPVLTGCEVAPADVFTYGFEELIIIKEVAGTDIYWPAMGIFTLEMFQPGKAYEMLLTGTASLYYPACDDNGSGDVYSTTRIETPWNNVNPTGSTHTIAFGDDAISQIVSGDVIGAFTQDGLCVGVMEFKGVPGALTVFADDITTNEIDGMSDDENISFRFYRPGDDLEGELEVTFRFDMPSRGTFEVNGLSDIETITLNILDIEEQKQLSIEVYPNPSSGTINIETANSNGFAALEIINSQSQVVYVNEKVSSSMLQLNLNLPDGIYFVKIRNNSGFQIKKIIISK